MRKSLLHLGIFLLFTYPALGEEFPYQEIQQAIEKEDYLSALNLTKELPKEEKLYLSGILKEKLGSHKEAIEFFRKYLEESKLLADYSFFHIANNYYSLGNFPEASLWYAKAEPFFKRTSLKAQILERLGESYERMNRFEEAIGAYQRLGNDKGLFSLAKLYEELGRKEEAIEVFWKLVKNFPRSPLSIKVVPHLESLQKRLSPEEEFSLADVFYKNRLYRKAERRFSLLLNREISSFLCSKTHYLRGKSLFWLWDYRGTLREYSRVYPETKKVHYEKGVTLQKLKRYKEAIDEYKKVADSESLWQIARCYVKSKDYSGAIKTLEKLLHSFPEKEEQGKAAYFLGKYLEKIGNKEKAKASYSRLTKLPYTFYYYRACQEGKISPPQKQEFTEENSSPQKLSDLEKKPELKRVLFLLRLGIRKEAILELKKLERKSRSRKEFFTLFYLYQEARAYPQAIVLGFILKNRRMRYPLYYQDLVEQYSQAYHLDPHLTLAMIWQESRFGKEDVSSASATGLMQIIPSTGAWIAKRKKVRNYQRNALLEPETSINFGCYYFRHLLNSFDDNIILALCAYNGGPENVVRWLSRENDIDEFVEDIPYSETYNYVKKVISAYQQYQNLYGTQINADLQDK